MRKAALGLALGMIAYWYPIQHTEAENVNPSADNTRQNLYDRSNKEPTAQNQSNKGSEVRKSARLRRAIMARKDLSVNAQNVKIINENGYVTLRGPVDTSREKQAIDTLAQQYCGPNYRNELEVKK